TALQRNLRITTLIPYTTIFRSRAMQEFHGQMHLLKNELQRWKKGDYSVIILAPNQKRAEKIHSIFMDYGIDCALSNDLQLPVYKPTITIGNISSGIELPMHKLVLITEQELFQKQTRRKRRKPNISNAERIKSYQELK